jgi:DNA-binding CsgD family transcriptional regulator
MAEEIPAAEYVELPGSNHTIFVGDQRAAVEALVGFLDRRVAPGALSSYRRADRKDSVAFGWNSLTPSEREIAELIASGLTNRDVATRLGMSRYTVDGRLRRIFAKLGVNSRVELTAEVARANV